MPAPDLPDGGDRLMPWWLGLGSFLRDRTPGAGMRRNGKAIAKRRDANKHARRSRKASR